MNLSLSESRKESKPKYSGFRVELRLGRRLRFRQRQGGLAEDVAPACWSPNISIAKPELVIGWFTSPERLDPQQRSHHGCVTPYPDLLRSRFLVLAFIGDFF